MAFDDCRVVPIPGCSNYRGSEGVYQASSRPESAPEPKVVTGEVCLTAIREKVISTRKVTDRWHGETWEISVPPYSIYDEWTGCVDVYNGDVDGAMRSIEGELAESARSLGFIVTGYRTSSNCPGTVGRALLWLASLFSDALDQSDKYCE